MPDHFTIITATTPQGGIGINGTLPWSNITDMKYFRNITTNCLNSTKINAVIMGRKTLESLHYRPLPNRLNICITSYNPMTAMSLFFGSPKRFDVKRLKESSGTQVVRGRDGMRNIPKPQNMIEEPSSVLFFSSFDNALSYLYKQKRVESIYVIGGAMMYQDAITHKDCSELVVNEIDCEAECDTFFPEINDSTFLLAETRNLGNGVTNRRYLQRRIRGRTF